MRVTEMKENSVIYTALGFPVTILNPTYRTFEGEQVMDVNPTAIMEQVFHELPGKRGRLTGAEVRFLRSYLKLTQAGFGQLLGVDHTSVAKWEAKKAAVTGMEVPVEVLLRAQCKLHGNSKAHIGKSFLDNLLNDSLARQDAGEPLRLAI